MRRRRRTSRTFWLNTTERSSWPTRDDANRRSSAVQVPVPDTKNRTDRARARWAFLCPVFFSFGERFLFLDVSVKYIHIIHSIISSFFLPTCLFTYFVWKYWNKSLFLKKKIIVISIFILFIVVNSIFKIL